jgi:3-dehydroquinate synthase
MTAIRVAHAGADYEVVIGPLAQALPRVSHLARGVRLPLVSDKRVFGLHGHLLADVIGPEPILAPEGEAAKSWETVAAITDRLAALDVKRGTPVIALGGGSVGDVAGLAASLFKRGCPIIHVPTTLLAQADSAIGGKTAIDAGGQKNLIGTFHHPALVIADPALLDTLDERQLHSGYAEIVKYGLIDDRAFFGWCEGNGEAILTGDPVARYTAIEHCVKAKARFVSADPDDSRGKRALLNLGHTFGHAIEGLAEGRMLHGEAIAIGMTLAFRLSADLGLCAREDAERVSAHLTSIGLPATLPEAGVQSAAVFNAMQSDKKSTAAGLVLILTRGIGQAFVTHNVELRKLAHFLAAQR